MAEAFGATATVGLTDLKFNNIICIGICVHLHCVCAFTVLQLCMQYFLFEGIERDENVGIVLIASKSSLCHE